MDTTSNDPQIPENPFVSEVAACQKASPVIRFVQIFLLMLIFIGLGLLATTKFWVPKVVAMILDQNETLNTISSPNETIPIDTKQSSTTAFTEVHTYNRSDGHATITISQISPSEVFVTGLATWQGANENELNDGYFEATTTIESGEIFISEVAASSASINSCVVTIEVSGNKSLTVDDESCIWGLNVTFSGRYTLSIPKELHASVLEFIPTGWEMIASSTADSNQDGFSDTALVIEKTEGRPRNKTSRGDGNPRKLLILLGSKDGYLFSASSETLILRDTEGGLFGDPFDGDYGLKLSAGKLEIYFYAGSSSRWSRTYTFMYDDSTWRFSNFNEAITDTYDLESEDCDKNSRFNRDFLTGIEKKYCGTSSKPTSTKNIDLPPLYLKDVDTTNLTTYTSEI
jgi:hypothetical protein